MHTVTQCYHQEVVERQFEISKEDHLNIQLAEAVGVRHLAVSYPQVPVHGVQYQGRLTLTQDINCTLARAHTADSEVVRVCTNVSVPVCRWGWELELQKKRFAKISQSQRRPLSPI